MTETADRNKLWAALVVLFSGVLFYSQVTTLDWDEGFHLVAARLIAAGKRPYVDFCFPQPSIHALWNAIWLRFTNGGWRGPHVVAALLTCGAIAMTADFVWRRYPVAGWRLAVACAAAIFFGLNAITYEFGTKAQGYGAALFLSVAAYRISVEASRWWGALASGCLSGAAAASTLLAAPVCPVLFIWYCRQRRSTHVAAFLVALAIPLAPMLLSLIQAPYQTWFNLVGYHIFFRHVGWTGAGQHDILVLTSWVDCAQSLLLGIFSVAGLWFIRKNDWIRPRKAEFYLAAWLAIALILESAVAHPTFPQYFIFVVPFLALLAAVGICEVASRLTMPSYWVLAGLAIVSLLSLANSLAEIRDDNKTWTEMDAVAHAIEQVTPPGAPIMADPPVYFALKRDPPPGMEFPASHRVDLPEAQASALHIIPQKILERRVRAGDYAAVETCNPDEDEIRSLNLSSVYSHSQTVAGCAIYWGVKQP